MPPVFNKIWLVAADSGARTTELAVGLPFVTLILTGLTGLTMPLLFAVEQQIGVGVTWIHSHG
jgi:hypothetical protein